MVMRSSISSAGCLRAFFNKSLMGSESDRQCAGAGAPQVGGKTADQGRKRKSTASGD